MDFLNEYQNHLETIGLSNSTVEGYTSDVSLFAKWLKGSRGDEFDPANIVPRDLTDYRSYLLTVKGYKKSTVNRKLSALSSFLEWARDKGLTETRPPEGLQAKPKQRKAPRSLDRKEQAALLREVSKGGDKRDIALITLMLNTGLRSSEVADLKLEDIELYHRSSTDEKGRVHVREGKGSAPRDVPLNSEVRSTLRDYLEKREDTDSDYLFLGQRGPLTTKGVTYIVNKYAYQAKLDDVTPHTLRHTFGKNLVDAGVSLDRVGLLLGHASLDTTKIYTKPTEADLERDVENITTTPKM